MTTRRILLYVAVGVPPLVLAAVGLTHPHHLTAADALYWRNLHIAILPVFPLLGFAPWLVGRGRNRLLGWVLGALGFLYAAFYSALDVLAGIGAGGLKLDGMGMTTGIRVLYSLARTLGGIGSVALIAACAIVAVVVFRRVGVRSLPGGILVIVGSVLFLRDHIYFPVGVIGQLCLAVGWVLLVAVTPDRRSSHPLVE